MADSYHHPLLGGLLEGAQRKASGLPFTTEELERTEDLNCGPVALSAITGRSLSDVRVAVEKHGFAGKHYTNPTMMYGALRELGVRYHVKSSRTNEGVEWPSYGLARIQWGGPWTKAGVPMAARYRQTHWVASWITTQRGHGVFDVNAGNWTTFEAWREKIVPWLLKEAVPRADGTWWVTHAIEVVRA